MARTTLTRDKVTRASARRRPRKLTDAYLINDAMILRSGKMVQITKRKNDVTSPPSKVKTEDSDPDPNFDAVSFVSTAHFRDTGAYSDLETTSSVKPATNRRLRRISPTDRLRIILSRQRGRTNFVNGIKKDYEEIADMCYNISLAGKKPNAKASARCNAVVYLTEIACAIYDAMDKKVHDKVYNPDDFLPVLLNGSGMRRIKSAIMDILKRLDKNNLRELRHRRLRRTRHGREQLVNVARAINSLVRYGEFENDDILRWLNRDTEKVQKTQLSNPWFPSTWAKTLKAYRWGKELYLDHQGLDDHQIGRFLRLFRKMLFYMREQLLEEHSDPDGVGVIVKLMSLAWTLHENVTNGAHQPMEPIFCNPKYLAQSSTFSIAWKIHGSTGWMDGLDDALTWCSGAKTRQHFKNLRKTQRVKGCLYLLGERGGRCVVTKGDTWAVEMQMQ